MVAVPHAEGARGTHRQEGDLSTELDPGGVDGTREIYHFAGANTPKYDALTTTKGLEDIELVLKKKGGGHLTEGEESRLVGLGEVKVIHTGRWTGDEAGEPVSGEEVVDVSKVKRTYRIGTRLASCFCSALIRGLPRQQSVPGYRSRTEGRSSKGNGQHGHWGSAGRRKRSGGDRFYVTTENMSDGEGYWDSVARERLGGCFQVVGGAWKGGRTHTYCPFRIVGWFLSVFCF